MKTHLSEAQAELLLYLWRQKKADDKQWHMVLTESDQKNSLSMAELGLVETKVEATGRMWVKLTKDGGKTVHRLGNTKKVFIGG